MSLLRAAGRVSFLTLVSRVLGLVRDSWTYHVFGMSWVSGAFVLAWTVPNLLRRLLGEGALSAAFVPAFARARTRGGDVAARSLLASVGGTLIVGLGGFCALVVLASFFVPPAAWHLAPGSDAPDVVTSAQVGALFQELLAILFPYALPVCLLAIWSGALNSLGSFGPGAAAPIVLNLFWLAALALVHARGGDDPTGAMRTVAWFLLAGGIAQLVLAAVFLRRRGFLTPPRLPGAGDAARGVFAAMLPTALGMSVVQLNVLLDQTIAAWLIGAEAINHVYLANRLLLFPHALVALPLATVVFPRLAEQASRDDGTALRKSLDQALSITLMLAVPAAVGLAMIADELLLVAFQHGHYSAEDVPTTRWTTVMLVAGLPAIGSAQLQARALYALGDTRTPALVSAWLVVANVVLNLVLVGVFGFGVPGLTAATSACAFANALILRRVVGKRIGRSGVEVGSIGRTLIASAVMAGVILAVERLVPAGGSRLARAVFGLALPIGAGIGTWFLALHLLRSPELAALRRRVARRVTPPARTPANRSDP